MPASTRSSPSAAGSSNRRGADAHRGRRVDVRGAGVDRARPVLRAAGGIGIAAEPDRLRPLRPGRSGEPALRGARQLRRTPAHADLLEGAVEHHLFRRRRGAAVDRGFAGRRAAARLRPGARQGLLPHRAVRAGGHHPGGGGGDLALPLPHQLWPGELGPGAPGRRAGRLAGRPAVGDADDHRLRGVEEFRLQHGDPARRPAGGPARALRGRAHRRCLDLAADPAHHPAVAGAGAAGGVGDHGVGLLPALRRALCHDPGRPAAVDGERAVPDVRGRLQVVEPGAGVGRGLHAVPGHPGRDHPAAAGRPQAGPGMSRPVGGTRFQAFLVNGALALFALLALAPLAWMVSVSFMPMGEASRFPPPLLPTAVTLDNYRELFTRTGIGRAFANSLVVSIAITVGSLLVNAAAGYAFAKLRFRGRERLFQLMLAALVVPAQVAMLPLFLLMKELGLVNSLGGVVVPALAGVFGIFLVRQYARSIPDALVEAARIDGAGELRIFLQVVLPMLRPVLVTLAIFTFMAAWNDFMWPLIVLADQQQYTLPVALAALSREHIMDVEMMMAGAVVTVLPVLLLFLALQRWYMQGLLLGSVKG